MSTILAGFILGGSWFLLVIFGLHWALVPIMLMNFQIQGYDILLPAISGSTFAQIGIALAFFLRAKTVEDRALGGSSFITYFIAGITEPIVYGIILKYRYMVIITFIFGGIFGAIASFLKVTATFQVAAGALIAYPAFIWHNFIPFVIAAVATTLLTALIAFLVDFRDKSEVVLKTK